MDESTIHHLSKDPILKLLIETFGVLHWKSELNLFADLVSSIISQQLSVKAASTIEKRFVDLFGHFPVPQEIVDMDDESIRGCGISYSKIKYIKGISQAVIDDQLEIDSLPTLSDENVIVELTKLKGVGRWTAEMFLIFSLGRQDVFSLGDLGLRSAVSKLYKVDRDNLVKIEKISQKWSPYRSWASRYLWKSLDNSPK